MKDFKLDAVVSVYSGVMCCDNFSQIHECIEFLMGRPVFTHELPNLRKRYCLDLIDKQLGKEYFSGVTKENALEWSNDRSNSFVSLCKLSTVRHKSPKVLDKLEKTNAELTLMFTEANTKIRMSQTECMFLAKENAELKAEVKKLKRGCGDCEEIQKRRDCLRDYSNLADKFKEKDDE